MVCTPHFIASAHSIRQTRSTPVESLAQPTICYLHFAPRVLHFSAIHSSPQYTMSIHDAKFYALEHML